MWVILKAEPRKIKVVIPKTPVGKMRWEGKAANKGNVIIHWRSLEFSLPRELPEPIVTPYPKVKSLHHCSNGGVTQLGIYSPIHTIIR